MAHVLQALIGPTASGKESAAVDLAERAGWEILSLDSMKVYRGMDLGTAKAPAGYRERVPHHLLDLVSPACPFSTRAYLDAAKTAERDVRARGAVPLYSGGTPLYLKALLFGLFEGPSADPDIRARLRARSGEELHTRLTEADPVTAARVHPNDVRRLVRALEVHEITGIPVSELRREWRADTPGRPAKLVGIRRDRSDLYARIDLRVDRMIEAGLVPEIRELLAAPEGLGPIARQALGYKEIADWIEGAVESREEAVRLVRRRTRLFARRQLTWFKHFDVEWLDAAPDATPEEIADRAATAFGFCSSPSVPLTPPPPSNPGPCPRAAREEWSTRDTGKVSGSTPTPFQAGRWTCCDCAPRTAPRAGRGRRPRSRCGAASGSGTGPRRGTSRS